MKLNYKKNPPSKYLLIVRLLLVIALGIYWICTMIFWLHPDNAEIVTRFQLLSTFLFLSVYIDYMISKLRFDIFGGIGNRVASSRIPPGEMLEQRPDTCHPERSEKSKT